MTFLCSSLINPGHCLLPVAFFGVDGRFLIPITGMAFVFGVIVVGAIEKLRRERLRHETIQRALDRGQALPPDLFSQASLQPELAKLLAAQRPRDDRRGGLIAIAVGIGVYVFFSAMQSEGVPDGIKWVGLIPGLIGVAQLVNWALERGEKKDPGKP